MKTEIIIAALVVLFSSNAALANDSMATVATSGITFVKSKDIQMQSEDLYISEDMTRVKYVFRNLSDHDVTGTVTFPLPKIDLMDGHAFLFTTGAGRNEKPLKNPFAFQLKVNGKKTAFKVDTTTTTGCMDGELCSVTYNYYWQQRFPAKAVVTVEHSYKTAYGTGPSVYGPHDNIDWSTLRQDYCADIEALEAQKKKIDLLGSKKTQYSGYDYHLHYFGKTIDYILMTANNWRGPIGHFRMTISSRNPDATISMCWPSPFTKNADGSLFFEQENFSPQQDLKIILIPTQEDNT